MADGDFLDLQNNLAVLAGRASAADLDEDLSLCKQVINEAQTECYRPVDGRAPEWARTRRTLQFRGPTNIAIGLTQGTTAVTGYAFPTNTVGSVVAIGTNFYTYAGTVGAVHHLVEPALETTGTYQAVLWHNSHPLAASTAKIMGAPDRQGWGPLSPMTDGESELRYRSRMWDDYRPSAGTGYTGQAVTAGGGSSYPMGDPTMYRVEIEQLLDGAAAVARFMLLPLPMQACNVSIRAEVFPVRLVNNADRPVLLADRVLDILLPIAREKWGITYKKYTGQNAEGLIREANKAREILSQSRSLQSRGSGQAVTGRT